MLAGSLLRVFDKLKYSVSHIIVIQKFWFTIETNCLNVNIGRRKTNVYSIAEKGESFKIKKWVLFLKKVLF